jgi:hypothetical protein
MMKNTVFSSKSWAVDISVLKKFALPMVEIKPPKNKMRIAKNTNVSAENKRFFCTEHPPSITINFCYSKYRVYHSVYPKSKP